jgi:hypothetical protein
VVIRLEVERGLSLGELVRGKIARARRDAETLPKRLGNALDKALQHIPALTLELPEHLGSIALKSGTGASPADFESGPLAEVFELFNEALHAQKRRLAILIDEVQDADVAALGSIAAAVHQSAATDSPILLAVAGLPQAELLFKRIRTYTQRWDHLSLELLTRAEIVSAIRIPLERAGVSIDNDAIDLLAGECAGYPYFVQLFASTVWNERKGARITFADIERSLPPVRAKIEKTFYRDVLDRLTTRELAFVIALAELGSGPRLLADVSHSFGVPSERLGSVRANLIKKDVIISPGPRLLEFRIPLLDRFVREHRSEIDDAAIDAYREELRKTKE